MVIIIISRSSSKMGHVGSKTRSLGQILKSLVYTLQGTVFRMSIIIISRSSSKPGDVGSKTRSLGQILEKPCVPSRGHSVDLNHC